MKNSIIAACLVAFVSFQAYSQEAGIKGGVNFSNLYVTDVDDENMKVGFNAGIYYNARISDAFAIQPEFLYSLKGAEVVYGSGLLNLTQGKHRFNLGYVDIPLGFNVYPSENFFLQVGPYVSVLMNAKVKRVDADGDRVVVKEFDRDEFNTFDYGLFGGLGFGFDGGGSIGARYSYGLQEIGESGSFTREVTANSKNSVFQIYLAFPFQ